ncbi:hypothetical protein [Gluconobacter kanchanaburiensis]|uniref:Uncharacterized protein n=1 Tax=Gluconobacter kanchanaburiensis NBRC 103587 TaxID=1307948 RepID=A0A511B641_9PROT|nr:hypothetical protein [Gluconobacter kanchanaburiensis]MBF0861252.1 hypothetical protein [Gluconobacter kanchanaburiensis]GBR70947.1 hypothetical protein AA103587_2138 [Gluconobacter kanchanaburiensis NBRC 103587]GEK95925.1 hypothetical protein GKA01_11220 [Gluconobacter kanchanaburiensis NBRC 103587]
MDFSQNIVELGTLAVKLYRDMSGIQHDNEIPEIFLGGQIALGLHNQCALHAHVERPYLDILRELGGSVGSEEINAFGGLRADVAIYKDNIPIAIIELKICDEGDRRGGKVLADLEKMKTLSEGRKLDTYLGILLTDMDKGLLCDERRTQIEALLEGRFSGAGALEAASRNAGWNWQFLSGKF